MKKLIKTIGARVAARNRGELAARPAALLLCLLCLAGCAAPEATSAPGPAPVAAASPTAAPALSPEEAPLSSRTIFDHELPSAKWMAIAEGEPAYLSTEDYATDIYRLFGDALSIAQIEALASRLKGTECFDLTETLAGAGVEVLDGDIGHFAEESALYATSCEPVLDGEYIWLHFKVSNYYSCEGDLFFRKAKTGGFVPYSLLLYCEGGPSGFLELGDQRWWVCAFGAGRGTGLYVGCINWYNLDTNRVELQYPYTYMEACNVSKNVYQTEELDVYSANILRGGQYDGLELYIHAQLDTKYWPVEEEGEIAIPAPSGDMLALRMRHSIYYDPAVNAFFTRMPDEAYLLNYSRKSETWRFYFADELSAMARDGNLFQRQWAESFSE